MPEQSWIHSLMIEYSIEWGQSSEGKGAPFPYTPFRVMMVVELDMPRLTAYQPAERATTL